MTAVTCVFTSGGAWPDYPRGGQLPKGTFGLGTDELEGLTEYWDIGMFIVKLSVETTGSAASARIADSVMKES